MKIAYLTSQYPSPSHSFIRREIHGLESLGVGVERFSIRAPRTPLIDPGDLAERRRTHVLCEASKRRLAQLALAPFDAAPRRLLRAAQAALTLGAGSRSGVSRHCGYLVQACMLRAACLELGCTHVHAHLGSNPAAVAMLCRELGGPPFSFTVHGPEELEDPAGYRLGDKIRAARFVVAITDHCRRALEELSIEAASRVRVVRCGLDARWLQPEPTEPPDAPRVVAIGRLVARKRHVDLVHAVARLRLAGVPVELRIVGDGEERSPLERAIRELDVSDRVQLLGWRPEAEVLAELRAARVLALPSSSEGLPSVLFEAFALGRPVIASRVAGIPELVDHGVSGWLTRPGCVSDLVRSLERALRARPSELLRMGMAGRERVRTLHDIRNSARTLAELMGADPADESG